MEAFSLHLEAENFVFAFRITDPLLLFIKTDQQKLSLTICYHEILDYFLLETLKN